LLRVSRYKADCKPIFVYFKHISAPPFIMSNTTLRVIVAVVAAPIIIGLTLLGGWWFGVFVQALAVLALREFYDLADHTSAKPNHMLGYVGSFLAGCYFFFADNLSQSAQSLAFPAFVMLFVMLSLVVELMSNNPHPLWNAALTSFGVFYVGAFLTSLLGIRLMFAGEVLQSPVFSHQDRLGVADKWGAWLVFATFIGIWTCDSIAFFAGKAFGRHKLFPRVSPNKSWEGAVVGFVSSSAAFVVIAYYLLPFLPIVHAAILGALVGIVGQFGDLVESLFKRDAGVKDSSNLIPGHGGVYDRFDAAMFVAPVVYVYVKMLLLFS
jgi:phosphatidate cytidylyltransferase